MGYRTAHMLCCLMLLTGCGETKTAEAPGVEAPGATMSGETSKDGNWQGFIPYEWRTVRLQLTLTGVDTDSPTGFIDVPDLGALNAPVSVSTDNDRVTVATPFGATIEATFTGEALEGAYNGTDGTSSTITLIRHNPAFAAFGTPRLASDGGPALDYEYAEPANLGDG